MNEITSWEEIYDFAFLALQLLDKATLFSKKEVLKEYEKHKNDKNFEKLLLEKSIYPNGDKLGFYNTSKYTLKDILYQKEVSNANWYIIKEKFESENQFSNDIEKEKEFEEYLGDNFGEEFFNYREFEWKLIEEYNEYINGFSVNLRDLIYSNQEIFREVFYKIKSNINKEIPINSIENINDIVKNKENLYYFILNCIENLLELDDKYINYNDIKDLLVDVLFEDTEIEQNTTILHILPETPFILSCLECMRNKNPECQPYVYIITHSNYMFFILFLLNIIKFNMAITFFFNFEDEVDLFYIYQDLFKECDQFDYIIQSNFSIFDLIDKEFNLSNYNLQVSSRAMYIGQFKNTGIYDSWIKKDLLESLILIPFENTIQSSPFEEEDIFKLSLITTLNYNKSKKRKNKFLCVDKNLNYDVSSKKHSLEDFRNITKNNEVYNDSYKAFSEFINTDYSKIFNINEYMIENKYSWRHSIVDFNFNDEMYDVKMKSQKKFFEIEHFEDEKRVTKNMDYPIEKLGNLVKEVTEDRILESEIDMEENILYMAGDTEYTEQIAFFNSEIGDKTQFRSYKLVSEKISLQYLYYYLNSELGKNEFYYHLRGHKELISDVDNIRVPLPPKEVQEDIVETMIRSEELFYGMDQLKTTINKNFFNYEGNLDAVEEFFGKREYNKETQELSIPDNWQYAYSGLIWPLAITYLLATSGSFEKVAKANNLLRLFEFTVAFNSYVLISGIPNEIYEKNKTQIWDYAYDKSKNTEKYVKKLDLSFGSWDYFHGILTGIYKKEFRTEINKEFYMGLLDKKIRKNYTNLKNERNEQFHGGISNPYEAEALLNELNAPKLEIFNHMNSCYEKFRLYYTTGRVDMKTKEYEIIFLNGPYSMPIYSTIISEDILEPESLYLHDILENKFTKLNDNLIKFKAVDEMKHDWRLYIFIGFETDKNGNKKAKYRCYQRKEEDLFEDIYLNELM